MPQRGQLQQAKDKFGKKGEENADYRAAKAALRQAQLNLDHTMIIAPATGTLENFTLRKGSIVSANTPVICSR